MCVCMYAQIGTELTVGLGMVVLSRRITRLYSARLPTLPHYHYSKTL